MTRFDLLPDPRALLAAFEARHEQKLQELGRLRAALPAELGWVFGARCMWMLGKLRIELVPDLVADAIMFDRATLTVRYGGGDFKAELLVGWIVGNLSTTNFLGLWEARVMAIHATDVSA